MFAGEPINTPFRKMLNPVTPILSVEAFQFKLVVVTVVPDAAKMVAANGIEYLALLPKAQWIHYRKKRFLPWFLRC